MTLTNAFSSSNFFQTQEPVVFTNNVNAFSSSNFFQTQQPVVFTNDGDGDTFSGNWITQLGNSITNTMLGSFNTPFIDTPQPFLTNLPSVTYCIF
jgi:hypothetical protein